MKNITTLLLLFFSITSLAQQPEKQMESLKYITVVDSKEYASNDFYYPAYPNGIEGVNEYIQKNMRHPQTDGNKKVTGSATVQFVITKTGKVEVSSVEADQEVLKEEAIRLISSMDNWLPARYKGEPSRVALTQVIRFE